jgi:hypothetical protein
VKLGKPGMLRENGASDRETGRRIAKSVRVRAAVPRAAVFAASSRRVPQNGLKTPPDPTSLLNGRLSRRIAAPSGRLLSSDAVPPVDNPRGDRSECLIL